MPRPDRVLEHAEVGRPTAGVDVRPVGGRRERGDVGAETLEDGGRDRGVRPVGAVDGDSQPGEIGSELLEDVVDVALDDVLRVLDRAAAGAGRTDERLDLELVRVGQLVPLAIEHLDAVVLGRVVRGRHDETEILREERDGRRRQDPAEHGGAATVHDPAGHGRLERRAGAPSVAPDEDASPPRPERRCAADCLDELGRQGLADDAPDTVGAEPLPRRDVLRGMRSGTHGLRVSLNGDLPHAAKRESWRRFPQGERR